jgi:hypothetical protein
MSASVSLVRLIDIVRMEVSGATDGIIRKLVFNTLREFFRRTNIWIFELPVYIVPQTNDYVLNTCQNAIVIRLICLEQPQYTSQDPIAYIPGNPPQFIQYPTIPNYETQNPYPRVPRDGGLLTAGSKCPVLRIAWNPGHPDTWIATLSMSCADPVDSRGLPDGMPDWIIEKYFEYIAHGVSAKLMLQPNKSYSSPKLAEYNMRKFHEGVGIARTEVRHMFGYDAQRWMFPQTFVVPAKHRAV